MNRTSDFPKLNEKKISVVNKHHLIRSRSPEYRNLTRIPVPLLVRLEEYISSFDIFGVSKSNSETSETTVDIMTAEKINIIEVLVMVTRMKMHEIGSDRDISCE